MIDVHCHLTQPDYDADRDDVINSCEKELKAVITSSPHPATFRLALQIAEKYKDFVFVSLGLHPIYIKELKEQHVNDSINFILENRERIVGIGEIGLDYYHTKEEYWQIKQQELFREMIRFALKLKLPLVVHTRDTERTIEILEQEGASKVLMHLFSIKPALKRIINNNWSISIGPNIIKSKTMKKIARDMPLEKIMLETDSPWFGFGKRNTPLSIKVVTQEIAKIKKIPFEDVWQQTGENAVKFFSLPIKI
jgi:TatD DNase family protein